MLRRELVLGLAAMGLSFAIIGATGAPVMAQEHTKDTVATVKENVAAKKAVILDVREKSEWDAGHLAAASLLPLSKIKEGADLKSALKDLKPGTIVYCHCRAGRRALEAADALKKQGFDARALKPGFEELVKEGLEKAK